MLHATRSRTNKTYDLQAIRRQVESGWVYINANTTIAPGKRRIRLLTDVLIADRVALFPGTGEPHLCALGPFELTPSAVASIDDLANLARRLPKTMQLSAVAWADATLALVTLPTGSESPSRFWCDLMYACAHAASKDASK